MIEMLLPIGLLALLVYIIGALASWWTFFGYPASMR